MTIGMGERVSIRFLLLTGVLLLTLLSGSAFSDGTSGVGYNKTLENGDIEIDTGVNTYSNSGDGGAVTVSTGGGAITITGFISTGSSSGDGGAITVSTGSGDIETGAIIASSSSSSGAGGAVTVSTGSGAITIAGSISSSSSSGNGGAITVSTGSGDIETANINSSSSSSSSSGDGGAVTVSTGSGDINIRKAANTSSSSGDGGAFTVSTGSGDIKITDGDINSFHDSTSSSSSSGDGGAVTVSTGSGDITVGNINSYSDDGAGGAVKILAANGTLVGLGHIKTNGTVTINAGVLAGNIGYIGKGSDTCFKTGQVDITIGSVTGGAIGAITTNNADVNITAGGSLNLSSINAGSGPGGGRINLNANGGTFTLGGATTCSALNITVSKGGTFSTTSPLDLRGGTDFDIGTLTLDFGDENATNVYAKTTGAFTSSGTTEVTSIYGINGFAGTTYSNVFDTAVLGEDGNAYAEDIELNSAKDRYRDYILTNSGKDIRVENNNVIRQDVLGQGGSQQAADAANNLIDNQINFDSDGREFVYQFTELSGSNLLRASREVSGEEATTATMQAGIQSVSASAGAVRNQMTTFRMGSVASGLASSFSSGGSTAATSDMADADELSEAYTAVDSDFTTDSTVYRQTTVWADVFGGFGEQGTKGDTTGYDFWNAGTMVGLDYAFAEELRIGGLLGYSYNKASLYQDSGDSRDNALRLGGYASYNWDGFFVDISPSVGIHIIEANRKLITNGLTAKGERVALDFNINGSIGYTFNLPYDIQFTPSYSLGYTLFHDPDYTETGAGAGNLSYSSFNSNSLLQDTGVKFGKLFRVSEKLAYLPEVWGGLEVEYLNTGGTRNSTTSTSIGGSSYTTSMSSLETYRGYWGAGITALVNDNVSVFGRYDHKVWHKGYNAGFSAGIKVVF